MAPAGGYISHSKWDSADGIERSRESTDHDTIRGETHVLEGARAVVFCHGTIG